MIRAPTLLAAVLVLAAPLVTAAQSPPATVPPPPAAIEPGSTVQIEYTLTDDAGAVLDTNTGKTPLTYVQGEKQIAAGLEKHLAGMRTGDEKKVVLRPEDAYGAVDPAAQAEVARDLLPPEALVVGARLIARDAAGDRRPVIVKEIKGETVIIDLNHPLAGKTLLLDVKVLSVEPPNGPAPKANEAKPGS